MANYWIEKDNNKKDGWIYLSHDFRIKHEHEKNHWTYKLYEGELVKVRVPMILSDGCDEIHPHNIIEGRIKAVQK